MQPLLFLITKYDTVQQCIVTSIEASRKLNQQFTFITMDLAAAKIALDVKWNDLEKYENVVIHLGAFHTMCSYMGALGRMMTGSRFEDIVIEAGICASGSIRQVMSGQHYNRAMHTHLLMMDAVERLLMQSFSDNQQVIEQIPEIAQFAFAPTPGRLETVLSDDNFTDFAKRYNEYKDAVREGGLGRTAQFWLAYADSVWHLLRFHRAIKENNLDDYLSAMYQLCSLLFSSDRHSYAQYLPLYYCQLKTLTDSNPEARGLLKTYGLSVARSCVPACRNAVDLTIEQTINRSAKTAGGIVGFSRKPSAYYKWCLTRHTRSTNLQATLEQIGMVCDVTIHIKALDLQK